MLFCRLGKPPMTMRKHPPVRGRAGFDQAFYRRFYLQAGTRVHEAGGLARQSRFLFAYLDYLGIKVKRVLDLGCGLGHWRKLLSRHHPRAAYVGVETSEYLCRRHGWTLAGVAGFRESGRRAAGFDLVICQSVFQYLGDAEVKAGLANVARHCRGAAYLEIVTRLDWERHCNRNSTDGRIHLRSGAWYRRQIGRYFRPIGGGLFLPRHSPAVLYELEGP